MPERATYIVTGGAGFVGANLVAALLARDPRPYVAVVDDFRSGSFANIVAACGRAGVEAFRGEVVAESAGSLDWREVVRRSRPRAVFHLGAITDTTIADEREMILANVGGFSATSEASMLAACSHEGIPLVYASSAATYGTPPQAARREPFPVGAAGMPSNVYGFSKWLMECEHRRFVETGPHEHGRAHIVGLRYFNVFGPGEAHKGKMASMVYQLAQQMLRGEWPRVFADGSQARDQVYIDDVVECTLAAAGLGAKKDVKPGVYNLGSGVATSFNEIIAALRPAVGASERSHPTEYFEMPPAVRAFYQDYTCADMSETERGLGWKPTRKPVDAMAAYGEHLRSVAGDRTGPVRERER